MLSDNSCLCDLGYAGELCELSQAPSALPRENSIALFIDAFGELNSQSPLSLGYEALAIQLADKGYDVTVIYTGAYTPAFNTVASKYKNQKISIVK